MLSFSVAGIKGLIRIFRFGHAQAKLLQGEVIRRNCALSKLYLPFLIQIPFWIATSVALRSLTTLSHVRTRSEYDAAAERFVQLQAEGLQGVCPDLTIPDPTWIIPVVIGLAFLANVELGASRVSKDLLTQGGLRPMPLGFTLANNIMRSIALVMVPVSAMVPSVVAVYWASSAVSGFLVNIVVMSPKFRGLVRIPSHPTDDPNPYRGAVRNFKDNWKQNFVWFNNKLI